MQLATVSTRGGEIRIGGLLRCDAGIREGLGFAGTAAGLSGMNYEPCTSGVREPTPPIREAIPHRNFYPMIWTHRGGRGELESIAGREKPRVDEDSTWNWPLDCVGWHDATPSRADFRRMRLWKCIEYLRIE